MEGIVTIARKSVGHIILFVGERWNQRESVCVYHK